MQDLLDITDKVLPVAVVGSGVTDPLDAYTDGQHYYFDDANAARVGAHLTGRLDLASRPVLVERVPIGWQEHRGRNVQQVHRRHIGGHTAFRFDEEWLFTVVRPGAEPRGSV